METNPNVTNQETEVPEEKISLAQETEILNSEIALIPKADQAGVQKVAKTEDLILIGKHRKKVTAFKRKYPAANFEFKQGAEYDKAAHDKAIEAEREVRNYRTKTVEPDFDNLKSPYVTLLKYYNEQGNPIIGDLKMIQAPIKAFIEECKKAKELFDKKEERELEERTNKRLDELSEAGAVFDSKYYSVGSEEFGVAQISLGMADINAMTDVMWEKIIADIKKSAETIAAKQKEKDLRVQKELEEKQEQERRDKEQLEKDQKALKEKNAKLRAKELRLMEFALNEAGTIYNNPAGFSLSLQMVEEMEDSKWDEWVLDVEGKMEAAIKEKAKRELISNRESELIQAGLIKTLTGFISTYKGEVFISNEIISTDEQECWTSRVEEAIAEVAKQREQKTNDDRIANEQKELAATREKELAQYWQFVLPLEKNSLGTITTDEYSTLLQRVKKQYSDKVNTDFKNQQNQIKFENEQRLAKAGDQAMYDDFVSRLQGLSVPEVTTDEYKNKVATIVNFIRNIK